MSDHKPATSDDTWPDYVCATCGGKAGDSDNSGVMVHGGYGSTRYDTSHLIWVVRGEDVFPSGFICDDCIDRAVAKGDLEEFASSLGGPDVGLHLSHAAYHELFAFGARKAYDGFWRDREDTPYQEAIAPPDLEKAILGMRYQLSGDELQASAYSTPRVPLGWEAVNIGYAHAVASIAFGCGEADPGFENAASEWATHRKALDAEADQMMSMLEDMIGKAEEPAEPRASGDTNT